jgi:hypothetical protein
MGTDLNECAACGAKGRQLSNFFLRSLCRWLGEFLSAAPPAAAARALLLSHSRNFTTVVPRATYAELFVRPSSKDSSGRAAFWIFSLIRVFIRQCRIALLTDVPAEHCAFNYPV